MKRDRSMVGRPVSGGAVGAAVGGTSLLFVLVLSACSTGSGGGNRDAAVPSSLSATASPSSPMSMSGASSSSSPSALPSAAAAPGGPAAAATSRVESALASLADRPKPSTADIRAALSTAGFAPAAVEVTASRTPTGLDADAVEAAVRQDRDCVVAQLRAGTLSVNVLPVLADGRCLAGPAS